MKKYFLFIVIILLSACATSKLTTRTDIKEIRFGYGGGVAQTVTHYNLHPDGSLYQNGQKINKVSKDKVKVVYDKADSLNYKSFDRPGNTFSYVHIVKEDTTLSYCWETVAAIPITNLFIELQNLIKE